MRYGIKLGLNQQLFGFAKLLATDVSNIIINNNLCMAATVSFLCLVCVLKHSLAVGCAFLLTIVPHSR
jgi:hypothetical protein